MIAVLPLLFIGALTFVEQNIADDVTAGLRHADLDRDGSADLILPSAVYFQRNGGFSQDGRVLLPDIKEAASNNAMERPICDVWNDTLFILSNTTLYLIRWENGAWQTVHSQPLTLPGPRQVSLEMAFPPQLRRPLTAEQEFHMQRFLRDINGDGVPEIMLFGEDALHVFRKNEQGYVEADKLNVYPPFQVGPAWPPTKPPWPEGERKAVLPYREIECLCNFSGNRLMVITEERLKDHRVRYRAKHYELDQGFGVIPEKTCEEVTEPLPGWFRPMPPGKDGYVNYGGYVQDEATTSAIPVPILEVRVTSDGGKTFQGVRAASSEIIDEFADLDGDGKPDIAMYRSDLFDGGVRETVARFLTALELNEELRIYLQDGAGCFPDEPSIVFPFKLKLDKPLATGGGLRHSRDTCTLRGDFDGDGHFDLLLASSPDELSVHLFEGDSFSKAASAVLEVKDNESCAIADVDGDGRSDIIVTGLDYSREGFTPRSRLFLSREAAP